MPMKNIHTLIFDKRKKLNSILHQGGPEFYRQC